MSVPPANAMPSGRLRVGQCVVDVASREVHAPGVKRAARLAPKSLAVLLTLARQPGQVVTREQLLAEVWPDTLPTNDVVTQAVTQLRKALASNGSQRFEHIETIAKTGYRLLAPVAWEQPSDGPADVAAPATAVTASENEPDERNRTAGVTVTTALERSPANQQPPVSVRPASAAVRQRRWMALALASVALLVVLALAARTLWMRAPDRDAAAASAVLGSPKRPYQIITAGGGFDLTPSLSPDGAMVAYASLTSDRAGTSIWSRPPTMLTRACSIRRQPASPIACRPGRRVGARLPSHGRRPMAAAAS